MATLHVATLSPSKLELLTTWMPGQPDLAGHASELQVLGAYRFDDPAGAVGIETHLLAGADGSVLHVPVTYRASPVAELADHELGTLEHSVLGTRWVYDGCADSVYIAELFRTILTGAEQAELVVQTDDGPTVREPNARVRGTGQAGAEVPTVDAIEIVANTTSRTITTGGASVRVDRVIDPTRTADGPALLGTWSGQDTPIVLAEVL